MRILLTADPGLPVPPPRYGGIERIVDALVRYYRIQGHSVALLAQDGSTSPAEPRFSWPAGFPSGWLGALRNTRALRRAVKAFAPDLVHSFSRLGYLIPLLPARLPKVMSYQRHTGGRQITWAARLGGRSLRFTGCSEFICRMGRPAGGMWQAIPNFVEPDRIDFQPQVPPGAPLLFLSRVESIKGPDLAIAIARAAGRPLLIAGNRAASGPEHDFWEQRIAPWLGRDGIEYVGEVDDAAKNALLGRAAALVVPLQWDEPFGIVFAEALAAGTPVITCARGALPEIIIPDRTGFFLRTIEDGVAAVARIPSLDRLACRQSVTARFSLPACAAQYLELYAQMLAGASSTHATRATG